MRTAVTGLSKIVTGDLSDLVRADTTVIMEDGRFTYVGSGKPSQLDGCDLIVDAAGAVAIPGLIDSHVHITFGDYTPRQRTVGFLESYVQGGVTTAISASEVHVPGRPKDPTGVKALAIAAHKSFLDYRPGGMTVHAGSIILEPGLTETDFADCAAAGVWLAKAGFGAFATPYEYADSIRWARSKGMITTVHTGGSSIPGSSGIWADHLLALQPDVSFHVNGGPVAMPDRDFVRLVNESRMALQVCTAGNLRTTLYTSQLLAEAGQLDRLLIATDTPTGSGVMPLGMLYTITHLASLGPAPLSPEVAIAAATGNNARTYRLNSGIISEGRNADLVIIDACLGGSTDNALDAIRNGDIPAVAAVFTAGRPRFVGKSRNTPEPIRKVRVTRNEIPHDFSGAPH